MKHLLFILMCCTANSDVVCQPLPDSILTKYNSAQTDADKGKILFTYFDFLTIDNMNVVNKLAVLNDYFKLKNDNVGQDHVQAALSFEKSLRGDFVDALEQALKVLSNFEKRKDKYGMMITNFNIGTILSYSKDFEQAIAYAKATLPTALEYKDTLILSYLNNDIASSYKELGKPDIGLPYALQSVKYAKSIKNTNSQIYPLSALAECYIGLKQYAKAIPYLKESLSYSISNNRKFAMCWSYNDFAKMYFEMNKQDSAKYYAYRTVQLSSSIDFIDAKMRGYEYLYKSFGKTQERDSVYKYLLLFVQEKEGLLNLEKSKKVQSINFKNQLRLQEVEQEKIELKNKIRTYGLLSGLGVLSILGFFLYRNNRNKQKANKILHDQKEKVENTLTELKSTQAQLIQSEKMASLGELTAGIAHEIQNPLNFVNNFSEVSNELISELKVERLKVENERDKELEDELLNDIAQNLEKINHHGKRASDIVKGMLEHSRTNTGQKEPTDINALCDEYLRLAYHGLRAKDKTFNATMETHFDSNLPKIEVVPQDIGRVILNLITNAFYAVNERNKKGEEGFAPKVTVMTSQHTNKLIITVKDNGLGIPDAIKDKIFQPFFTTKPTGKGTGLGLSLAYDIVKAHGGELKVESEEGKGTTFTITLHNYNDLDTKNN